MFALVAPARLGRAARLALSGAEFGRNEAWIPAAAAAEIVLLQQLGRTTLGAAQLRVALEAGGALRFLPLELAQIDEFAALGALRDPFDRLIAAAARAIGAHLITRDAVLAASGLVHTIWS